jgi:hypothetical protein
MAKTFQVTKISKIFYFWGFYRKGPGGKILVGVMMYLNAAASIFSPSSLYYYDSNKKV